MYLTPVSYTHLYDFFETGKYDKNREFILTSSPSMDILISSNLERLIYWAAGNDAKKNVEFMTALTKDGVYEITPQMQEKLKDFYGNYASEEETAEAIRTLYELSLIHILRHFAKLVMIQEMLTLNVSMR